MTKLSPNNCEIFFLYLLPFHQTLPSGAKASGDADPQISQSTKHASVQIIVCDKRAFLA